MIIGSLRFLLIFYRRSLLWVIVVLAVWQVVALATLEFGGKTVSSQSARFWLQASSVALFVLYPATTVFHAMRHHRADLPYRGARVGWYIGLWAAGLAGAASAVFGLLGLLLAIVVGSPSSASPLPIMLATGFGLIMIPWIGAVSGLLAYLVEEASKPGLT